MIKAASTEKKLNISLPLQHDDQTTLESGQDIIWQKLSVEWTDGKKMCRHWWIDQTIPCFAYCNMAAQLKNI